MKYSSQILSKKSLPADAKLFLTEQKTSDIDVRATMILLLDGTSAERIESVRCLGDFAFAQNTVRSDIVQALIDSLNYDEDSRVREEAAWALWKTQNKKAGQALLHALANDDEIGVKARAARALGLLGAKEASPLMRALFSMGRHVSARLRAALVAALGCIEGSECVNILLKAALDSEPSIRYEAIKSLGSLIVCLPKDLLETVSSRLIKSTNHRHERVVKIRLKAISALQTLSNGGSLKAIVFAAARDPDASVRIAAIEALSYHVDADSEKTLINSLADSNWKVRKAAGRVLAERAKKARVFNHVRVREALMRMERIFSSGSIEWRLAADAFASL